MGAPGLITYTDAAERLGVQRATVRDLMRKLGRTPKPVPYSPRGKGLDAEDMAAIEAALTPETEPEPAASA